MEEVAGVEVEASEAWRKRAAALWTVAAALWTVVTAVVYGRRNRAERHGGGSMATYAATGAACTAGEVGALAVGGGCRRDRRAGRRRWLLASSDRRSER